MTGTSITVTSAGDYVVFLSTRINGSVVMGDGSDTGIISIYLNGTQVSGTDRRILLPKFANMTVTTQAHIPGVSVNDVIEGRWRTVNGNTISLFQRSLILLDVN